MNLFSFLPKGLPFPKSFGFTWADGLVDDEETVQSEYNLRYVAKKFGIHYHPDDYIREKNSKERASRLEFGKKYYYMSHR